MPVQVKAIVVVFGVIAVGLCVEEMVQRPSTLNAVVGGALIVACLGLMAFAMRMSGPERRIDMDAEEIYESLRGHLEDLGLYVPDHADELLGDAAKAIEAAESEIESG